MQIVYLEIRLIFGLFIITSFEIYHDNEKKCLKTT
jgi:hypothetical protein